jgi:hypothetical protein
MACRHLSSADGAIPWTIFRRAEPQRQRKSTLGRLVHREVRARELAPRARFELATLRLTAECSTVELPGIIPIL